MRLGSHLLIATLLATGLAVAQNDATPSQAPATSAPPTSTAHARGELRLSAEQKQQIKSIRESARDQAAIIKHDTTLSAAQEQEKLQALRNSTREKIKAVLTPEQQKAAVQFKANRKARMEEKLGLTDDQKARVKDTLKTAKEQREAVLHNSGLSQEEKAAQLKQIRENAKAQMAQILTPEQQQKMQQLRGRRHGMRGRTM